MKNKLTLLVSFFSISLLISCKSNTNSDTLTKKSLPQTNNAIEGKILAGYQGWFNAKGDGSKLNWKHYGNNAKFYPGSASIDFWPGKLLDLAIDRNLISQTQYDEIWEDNTLRWLFGNDKVEAEKLIHKILS